MGCGAGLGGSCRWARFSRNAQKKKKRRRPRGALRPPAVANPWCDRVTGDHRKVTSPVVYLNNFRTPFSSSMKRSAATSVDAAVLGETTADRKRRLARERQRRHRQKLRREHPSDPATTPVPRPPPIPRVVQPPAKTDRRPPQHPHPQPQSVRRSNRLPQPSNPPHAHQEPSHVDPANHANFRRAIELARAQARVQAQHVHQHPQQQQAPSVHQTPEDAVAAARLKSSQKERAAPDPTTLQHRQLHTQQSQVRAAQQQQDTPSAGPRHRHLQTHTGDQQRQHLQLKQRQQQQHQGQQQQTPKHPQQPQQQQQQRQSQQQQQQQQQRAQRQHQQQLHQLHREQQRQQQQQRQYSDNLFTQAQAQPTFGSASGFTAGTQPLNASQANAQATLHGEQQAFSFSSQGFSTRTANVNPVASPTRFVADAQRQYFQQQNVPLRSTAYQGLGSQIQQRSEQRASVLDDPADAAAAAAGLTALPDAVNRMHTAEASPVKSTPAGVLGLPNAQGARYPAAIGANTTANLQHTQPGQLPAQSQQQQHQGQAPHASVAGDSLSRNPNESAEDRKRRLARDRQRRRRQRLKGEREGKTEADSSPRSSDPNSRLLAGGGTIPASSVGMGGHAMQAHGQGQIQGSGVAAHFEPGSLGPNAGMQSGLQQLHVPGVAGGQEDLVNGASRGGFSAHTLGVGGVSGSLGSGAVVGNVDRIGGNDGEVKEVPVPFETAEDRKRRLARDRQRKRRSRLKEQKKKTIEPDGKSPTSSQTLKNARDNTGGRLVENAEQRLPPELDRRAMGQDGTGDAARIPLGAPGSAVFGGRPDVGQSLGFGDQGRGLRGNSSMADGTGLNFGTGNHALNLQMPVGNIGSGVHSHPLMDWSQGFDSENSARFAVDSAVLAFRSHLSNLSPNGRTYVLQQGLMILSSSEEAGRIF